jgi:hypothetical protein
MGAVTEYLKNLIAKQVEVNRMVVWFDPERHYCDVANGMDIPNTTVACYQDSFFELRQRIDSLLGGIEPPRLVVYVPMREEESQYALVELTVSGVVVKPGQSPWQRNTRLSVIARNALKPILGEEAVDSIEKQVDAGQLSLHDLDTIAEDRGGKGIVSILFGTGDARQIALAFLNADAESKLYKEIVERGVMGEIASLLGEEFEVDFPVGDGPGTCQVHFARHILSTAFVADLAGDVPSPLATVAVAEGKNARRACQEVARAWRSHSDMRTTYIECSYEVEKDLGLSEVPFTLQQLSCTQAFLGTERSLQRIVEQGLLSSVTPDLLNLAMARKSGFWAEQVPEIQARWALIVVAGQVLAEADRVESEIRSEGARAADMIRSYASSECPWCLMDTYHRRMERHYQNLDFLGKGHLEALEKLVIRARQRYVKVGDELAQRFTKALQESSFKVPGVLRQAEVYGSEVAPLVGETKVAYILVDALRFEMGRELISGLSQDFNVEIKYAVAAVPTITEIGMAALMPRADQETTLIVIDKGRLALQIGEAVLKDRASRIKYLSDVVGMKVSEMRLDDLLVGPSKKTRDDVEAADFILVTSQEIDVVCERDNILLARRMMNDIAHFLQKACHVLVNLGVKAIVLTADHGYLFGEEVASDMKIDPPGGDTIDLGRRVWVGRGGSASDSFVRLSANDVGPGKRPLSSGKHNTDLEIAVPRGFGVFKVGGGSRAYFHGGVSLQELIVPVINLTPKTTPELVESKNIQWELEPGSAKITTRLFSVKVCGHVSHLFSASLPAIRVEIREGRETISNPVDALYGFDDATGAVEMRKPSDRGMSIEPNTVTLHLTRIPSRKRVTVHLLDAGSGRELARLDDIEVAIAI